MLTLLADAPSTCNSAWWNSFVGPIGVVFGAFITGLVTWRNARKSVYERLETLVQIHKNWPVGISGDDTLEHSIAIALAEIRRKEPGHPPEPTTEPERKADAEVKVVARRTSFLAWIGAVTAAVIGAITTVWVSNTPSTSHPGHGSASELVPVIATVITILITTVVSFAISRR
ncbi:hypothetical protein [Mycobacterium sp. UM_CSW]|uniref:hypothetical protein n=1 Tax=Mycobacterium sp. UM_CSW TaxID=1370119 RepID=UPI0012692A55|nr:hypothetical protein [Mycobacterium sp. UM_CSW]